MILGSNPELDHEIQVVDETIFQQPFQSGYG